MSGLLGGLVDGVDDGWINGWMAVLEAGWVYERLEVAWRGRWVTEEAEG